jgi:hypothetical protein
MKGETEFFTKNGLYNIIMQRYNTKINFYA